MGGKKAYITNYSRFLVKYCFDCSMSMVLRCVCCWLGSTKKSVKSQGLNLMHMLK